MAKQALLDVLEQTIGKYVSNLDANSLNLAVWSGKIELHGLELDVDAVNAELDRQAALTPNLAIPFRFTSGQFRSFQVDVPWAHLMSRSVVLRAQGLEIIVEPYDRTESMDHLYAVAENELIRAQQLQEARTAAINQEDTFRLRSNALKKIAEQDIDSTAAKKGAPSSTFSSRLVRRIIENIQVEISDVHISLKSETAAAGVELESFQLVTTDQDGQRAFVDRTIGDQNFLYKSLQINGLAVYLDENEERGMPSIREEGQPERRYILSPLSFTAKLRQGDSGHCADFPKYMLESELSSLSIMVSRSQIEMGWEIVDRIRPAIDISRPLFPEYRPLSRVTRQTALSWWKYACRCIRRLSGRSLWWEFFRAYQKRKMYIGLYKRHANHESCSWLQPLSIEELSELLKIEGDRSISVDGLMMWRNVADAQLEKEREKDDAKRAETKPSLFTSLFGSSVKASPVSSDPDDPPIRLSAEEMKELETAFMTQATNDDLDSNSKLCQISFTMGSMRVHLTSYNLRQLAGLEMGKLTSSFQANSDGSYSFDFQLRSLEIRDKITVSSLFPIVLQNRGSEEIGEAFSIHLHKTARGDQNLKVKLHTFEAVASAVLLAEAARFVAPPLRAVSKKSKLNPILAQSISGSVDLFYDTSEGEKAIETETAPNHLHSGGTDFSSALVDAWKEKTKERSELRVDLDLHAPVILVPENCVDPFASVLLFDFGHFRLQYGLSDGGQDVLHWFGNNTRNAAESTFTVLDFGSIEINDMSFSLVRADSCTRNRSGISEGGADDYAILEPVTLSVRFGVESCSNELIPRFCCFADMPSISLAFSKDKLSRIVGLATTWKNVFEDIVPAKELGHGTPVVSTGLPRLIESHDELAENISYEVYPLPKVYTNARLGRFSVVVKNVFSPANIFEAHLISAGTALTLFSDKSLTSQFSMGHFWVIENMERTIIRENRFLMHSPFPQSVTREDSTDDMIRKMRQFRDSKVEGTKVSDRSLADVSFRKSFVHSGLKHDKPEARTNIKAEFSGLTVNWNPLVMKDLNIELSKMLESLEVQTKAGEILVPSVLENEDDKIERENVPEIIEVAISVGNFQLILNSAKDDFPLFLLTMKDTSASYISCGLNKSDISVLLGDLIISTPSLGRTESSYKTILGLVPGKTQNLLKVRYTESRETMAALPFNVSDDVEACGLIELSPVRIVYIHSQILAIAEYATEGILGALAAQAASSAVAAAVNLSTPTGSSKLFRVNATGIEIVLPQAAYNLTYFNLYAGTLSVDYTTKLNGSWVANIALTETELFDSDGVALQDSPFEMKIDVLVPSDGTNTNEDQAMQVSINMPRAGLSVPKRNYSQLLSTLAQNIGDTDLYLRENEHSEGPFETGPSVSTPEVPNITHAGNLFVDSQRRIYVSLTILEMSLELDGKDKEDPIVRLSASNATIFYNLYPDMERTTAEVKLKNLICDDLRLRSLTRQYRSLVYQPSTTEAQDLFTLSYETTERRMTSVSVVIGSPRLVLIPDALAEILNYLKNDDSQSLNDEFVLHLKADPLVMIETELGTMSVPDSRISEENLSTFEFRLTTSRCSIILVDLGTEAPWASGSSRSSTTIAPVTETIAFEGRFDVLLTLTSDESTGETRTFQGHVHGEELESYTAFGKTVDSAMQLVEPTKSSLYLDMKDDFGSKVVDIRGAAMEHLEVILSMRNIALMNAILASISSNLSKEAASSSLGVLDDDETKRIEKLATELAADRTESSSQSQRLDSLSKAPSSTEELFEGDGASTTITAIQFTLPQVRFTLINDFQGLDEPLFRLSLYNSVFNGKVRHGVRLKDRSNDYDGFDFQTTMSIGADFFDVTSNEWKQLLLKNWEICSKGSRGPTDRYEGPRPSTAIDLECQVCFLSFSEQFLMGLASANRMWNVYSAATHSAHIDANVSKILRRSLAASAARKFVASLPYAVENQTGLSVEYLIDNETTKPRICESGSVEFFMFKPPRGSGSASFRVYGQDVKSGKTITIFIGGSEITINNVDAAIGTGRRSHALSNGSIIVLDIRKEGKTIVSEWRLISWLFGISLIFLKVILLTSGVEILNTTSIPFMIGLVEKENIIHLGICEGNTACNVSKLRCRERKVQNSSARFSVPAELLRNFRTAWSLHGGTTLRFQIAPLIDGLPSNSMLSGFIDIALDAANIRSKIRRRVDVSCREECSRSNQSANPPFVFKYAASAEEVDGHVPALNIFLEPRAVLENTLPISMTIRSPMPYIFREAKIEGEGNETYILDQLSRLEFFTPGPSIAIAIKCTDKPVCGTETGWIEGEWIDLPLNLDFMLIEPLRFVLPFARPGVISGSSIRGIEMFIVQGDLNLSEDSFTGNIPSDQEIELTNGSSADYIAFSITSCNFAVDHTGEILFEEVEQSSRKSFRQSMSGLSDHFVTDRGGATLAAYSTQQHIGRLTPLPLSSKPIRLLHLTMEGDDGIVRSSPFCLQDIMISSGGVESTAVKWEDGSDSGFYAYRRLISPYQSEIHVVPEYIVFNGSSRERICVKQPGGLEVVIGPGSIAPLRTASKQGAIISVECLSSHGHTAALNVEGLGLRIAVVRSLDGKPIGSLALQTTTGSFDSRLVVKIGELKRSHLEATEHSLLTGSILQSDHLRLRIQWTELSMSLYEARPVEDTKNLYLESAIDRVRQAGYAKNDKRSTKSWMTVRQGRFDQKYEGMSGPVCTVIFHRFTVDWQRVFKDDVTAEQLAYRSAERAQLSIIINAIQIKDDTPNSPYPVVLDSSNQANFFDLCIRLRGPLSADLTTIDLCDLNLAHANGASEKIIVNTSEEFAWKFLDLADRIVAAAGEFAGLEIELHWDEKHDEYKVVVLDKSTSRDASRSVYTPPQSEMLYDVKRARVSPFKVLLSFNRAPQASRYAVLRGVRGANLMNYFTQHLKFKIDRAELKFSRYEVQNVKGPPDRLLELISTVYLSRMKLKIFNIMTAASFEDWKRLADREGGDDAYMEGDILRVTGNIAGNTANLVFAKAGRGLGKGVSFATEKLGAGIENVAGAVGARSLGAGANSVISGVGSGVSETLTGGESVWTL
jgi:vacuolar protein sorting-associated protein 13A/C